MPPQNKDDKGAGTNATASEAPGAPEIPAVPAGIEAIIWDLDNTLYRFDQRFVEACNHISARTAIDHGVDLSFEAACAMAESSYAQWGFSGLEFVRNYNICARRFHFDFHDSMDESVIRKSQEMHAALAALSLPQAIITNASRSWAVRILTHLDLKGFFPDDCIFALEDSDFQVKANSTVPFQKALDKLDAKASSVLVVEDVARNLSVPKEMGFQTALVHHGRVAEDRPAYIDYFYADTLSLLKGLLAG